ncbi:hypothetical protein JCM12856_10740 [Spirochaeta dissipatitropha]
MLLYNIQIIKSALANRYKDFEDDLHIVIAEKQNVEFIITRNKKDFRSNTITIVDAEEFITIIKAG